MTPYKKLEFYVVPTFLDGEMWPNPNLAKLVLTERNNLVYIFHKRKIMHNFDPIVDGNKNERDFTPWS